MMTARAHGGSGWLRRWPGALAWLVLLLAALWCVWMLVGLAWAFLVPLDDVATGEAVHTQQSRPARPARRVAISQYHLFGNGHAGAVERALVEADRATKLDLVLHGTVVAGDGDDSYALIANDKGIERAYRVGDRIQRGVTLRAVHPDHVVLDHEGTNERLDLPRETLAGAGSVGALPSRHGVVSNIPPGRLRSASGTGTAGQAQGKESKPIYVAPRMAHGKTDWQKVRQQVQRDPAQVMAKLQLQPVFDKGQLQGVRLGSGAAGSLLQGTGLHADDVVTQVNGVKLDSMSRGRQLVRQLQDADHVRLTVLRGGTTKTLNIDLRNAH